MADQGNKKEPFLALARKIFDGPLWKERRPLSRWEALVWILKEARYSTTEQKLCINGRMVTWGRGQLCASVRFLQEAWQWKSKTKVTNFLKMLEDEGTIKTDKGQGINIITLCNYDYYNPLPDDKKTRDSTYEGQSEDGQKTSERQNSNKGNNDTNDNKESGGGARAREATPISRRKNQPEPQRPTLEQVKDYAAQREISQEQAEMYFYMRDRDDWYINGNSGLKPIHSWQSDFEHQWRRGHLNKESKPKKGGGHTGGSKGDRRAEILSEYQ